MDIVPTKAQSDDGAAPYLIMNNYDLIWEVLVHLPSKSLMRFKCVSKLWFSIIRNPKFAKSHRCRFRGLLFIDYFHYDTSGVHILLYANLNSPRLINHHMAIEQPNYSNITQIIKGLIGLYNMETENFRLCNIATREFVNLPPSPSGFYYDYFVGFDPLKEVFKVLNVFKGFDGKFVIHVFTLGVDNSDTKWRNITPPSLNLCFGAVQCVYIDDRMYWLPCHGYGQPWLTIFHLSSEIFETMDLPVCTKGGRVLGEMCGNLVLVVVNSKIDNVEIMDIWTMKNNCGGGEIDAWNRQRVVFSTRLNYAWMRMWTSLKYAGTLPTREMMLIRDNLYGRVDNYAIPIYIFYHHKNHVNLITMEAYGSQEINIYRRNINICYYEENIISIDCLMNNLQQDQTININ